MTDDKTAKLERLVSEAQALAHELLEEDTAQAMGWTVEQWRNAVWEETESSKEKRPDREAWEREHTRELSLTIPTQMDVVLSAIALRERGSRDDLVRRWLRANIREYGQRKGRVRTPLDRMQEPVSGTCSLKCDKPEHHNVQQCIGDEGHDGPHLCGMCAVDELLEEATPPDRASDQ